MGSPPCKEERMSREIKYKKVWKEVTVCEEGELVCDVCGKVIDIVKQNGIYYHIHSGHFEWGNDSIDSFNDEDACCEDCMLSRLKERVEDWTGYSTAFIKIDCEEIEDLRKPPKNK